MWGAKQNWGGPFPGPPIHRPPPGLSEYREESVTRGNPHLHMAASWPMRAPQVMRD
jgi:hypothetical protein